MVLVLIDESHLHSKFSSAKSARILGAVRTPSSTDMKRVRHAFPRFERLKGAVDIAVKQGTHESGFEQFEETQQAIRACFQGVENAPVVTESPLNGQISDELGATAKEAGFASMLGNQPLEPYFTVAHVLRNALWQGGNVSPVQCDDQRWVRAIRIALTHIEHRDPAMAPREQILPRDVTFAHAVSFFTSKGLPLSLVGDELPLEPHELGGMLGRCVSHPLTLLGDTLAMKLIDAVLHPRYDIMVQRVRLHPRPDNMGRKLDRSLPLGHLYRLALQALGKKRLTGKPRALEQEVHEATTHLAALYDVEPFNSFENMFPPYPHRVFEVLVEVIRYDELFSIPQCRPDVMSRLIQDIFSNESDDRGAAGWSAHDGMLLWHVLLNTSKENSDSTFIKRAQLEAILQARVGRAVASALIDAFVLRDGFKMAPWGC
ncbi:hypothetical protein [Burkholderia sp. Bp9143]|uniref:hypothetical protein n=1 Tax=Burkholderia sp. Bp9143 TaxID=2184574 RepID=UPI000F5A308F|nr:hypothetical protein [Burkholderia sp. Bp9143]